MSRFWSIGVSILAWIGVWAFWLTATHAFHPTFVLALIVTTTLVSAYAIAAYVNHLVLIPQFWIPGQWWRYSVLLAITMTFLAASALAVIRVSYLQLHGPDADPNGVYKHYAIDLFGMVVHVGMAGLVVAMVRRFTASHRRNLSEQAADD